MCCDTFTQGETDSIRADINSVNLLLFKISFIDFFFKKKDNLMEVKEVSLQGVCCFSSILHLIY